MQTKRSRFEKVAPCKELGEEYDCDSEDCDVGVQFTYREASLDGEGRLRKSVECDRFGGCWFDWEMSEYICGWCKQKRENPNIAYLIFKEVKDRT